jgi:hypothetical protein
MSIPWQSAPVMHDKEIDISQGLDVLFFHNRCPPASDTKEVAELLIHRGPSARSNVSQSEWAGASA